MSLICSVFDIATHAENSSAKNSDVFNTIYQYFSGVAGARLIKYLRSGIFAKDN
ncbi:MAG: hypothetical protein ACJASU_000893 [Cognaticolwellia sp.]|jgi:hypothetical protein